MLATALWYLFAALAILGGIGVVFSRNLVYSAYSLLFTLFGVAGLYVFLGADFLAAAQVLIYVGGILVLLLFGIMLTHRIYGVSLRTETHQVLPGLALAAALLFLLLFLAFRVEWYTVATPPPRFPTTSPIGFLFLTGYLLPFEVASVLLLAALIGAAYLVRAQREDEREAQR